MSVNSSNTIIEVSICDYISLANRMIKVILLLPLCIYLLYLCHQQLRQQHCVWSHSDLFTFHMAAMELFWIFGCFCLLFQSSTIISSVGSIFVHVAFYGEILFHVLTCMERYLAVVHPVIYHGLKSKRGHRIKIAIIGGVWLLSFALTSLQLGISSVYDSVSLLCLLILSIFATSFCSSYAIRTLAHPTPGLKKMERVDQSKQRALHTIIFLWSMLCLWFVMLLLQVVVERLPFNVQCVAKTGLSWFNLCNSLVLPLMYLHRTGKMSCSCNK